MRTACITFCFAMPGSVSPRMEAALSVCVGGSPRSTLLIKNKYTFRSGEAPRASRGRRPPAPDVRREDEDHVAEGDRPSLAVRDASVV